MNFTGITKEFLEGALEREIPDVHMLVAKNSVLGLDSHGIAEILGVDVQEILDIEGDQEYKEVRVHIAAHYNNAQIERDFNWDDVEGKALKILGRKLDGGNVDTETALKMAAVANRATRRHKSPVNRTLDAGGVGQQVKLTLTRRMIERLTSDGGSSRESTQEISITGGDISNPSFADIDQHLGVTARPRIPSNLSFRVSEPAHTPDEGLNLKSLDALMDEHMARRKNR